MGHLVSPPFALFILVDLPTIDDLLQKAHDGSTVDAWDFYLAVEGYSLAPQKKAGSPQSGTKAPVDRNFKSPFVGRSLDAIAEWVKQKPGKVDLEPKFFGLLDKKAGDGKIVLCRIGEDDKVTCVLDEAETALLELEGMEGGRWEQLLDRRGEYTPEI
ncbi:MAG: hypothetical protein LQ351_006438 [Letrouitia transgressa]|nr:MAG: hypothetical protein LQ351_006438 [Letrouitia transgressa]